MFEKTLDFNYIKQSQNRHNKIFAKIVIFGKKAKFCIFGKLSKKICIILNIAHVCLLCVAQWPEANALRMGIVTRPDLDWGNQEMVVEVGGGWGGRGGQWFARNQKGSGGFKSIVFRIHTLLWPHITLNLKYISPKNVKQLGLYKPAQTPLGSKLLTRGNALIPVVCSTKTDIVQK